MDELVDFTYYCVVDTYGVIRNTTITVSISGAPISWCWRDIELFNFSNQEYSKPRISRIQMDRQIYPSYVKIRLMRSEIKGFGTIVLEISSEICEDSIMRGLLYFHCPYSHTRVKSFVIVMLFIRCGV